MGQAKRRATKIRPKVAGIGIFSRFPNFDKCRSEVTGDAISGVTVYYVGMDVRATFCDSGLNSGRIILLFGQPSQAAFSTAFFRSSFRMEATRYVISRANLGQVGWDVPVKYGDSSLDRSGDIRLPHFVRTTTTTTMTTQADGPCDNRAKPS